MAYLFTHTEWLLTMKRISFLSVWLFVSTGLFGQNTYLSEKSPNILTSKGKYKNFVFQCDTNFYKFHSIYPSEWGLSLNQGFSKPEDIEKSFLSLNINDSIRLIKYSFDNSIDTLNNISWKYCIANNEQDSKMSIKIKVLYSYIMNCFNENNISRSGFPCVRILLSDGVSSKKWHMLKIVFERDSINYVKKEIELMKNSEGQIISSRSLTYENRDVLRLQKYLTQLQSFNSIESIVHNFNSRGYLSLLEYFDGKETRLYIFQNKKEINKEFLKIHGKIFALIWNL